MHLGKEVTQPERISRKSFFQFQRIGSGRRVCVPVFQMGLSESAVTRAMVPKGSLAGREGKLPSKQEHPS